MIKNKKKSKIKLNKNEVLTIVSLAVLVFVMFVNWSIYAWLVSLVVMIILGVWYFRQ